MGEFLIPAGYGEDELIEKKSRFISHVWLTETEEQALCRIKEMRTLHWDASHNVYAYIIGRIGKGETMRFSDDGEPGGTSGMPTLNVFMSEGISNVCCVTTRYFGGTLLGAGGLVRAYSAAAKLALDSAGICRQDLFACLLVSCSYAQYERVRRSMEEQGCIIQSTDFAADVMINALAPDNVKSLVFKKLTELTAGTVVIEETGTSFQGVRIR